jgi:putative transposase
MQEIDKIYTDMPYYGSPKITRELKDQGIVVNHKTVERLMRTMGLCAIYPQPNTSTPNPQHPIFPYLLKKTKASNPNHIWGTDITFIRGNGTWFYLTAIMDWYSRYVLSWRLSRTLTADFCCDALTEALGTAIPQYHNSDQGSQYTSYEYVGLLKQYSDIKISMDGRGRCFDNIFTERLWRSVKYEEVYLHDYQSFDEAHDSLQRYFNTYNNRRLHQSLDYKTPASVYYEKPSIN